MKLLIRLCLLAGLLALGYWLWTVFFPAPETVIRKRLAKVAELVSFNANEGQIARLANVQQLAGYFAPDIEISVDTPAQAHQVVSGRDDLSQKLMGARMMLNGLKVEFLDVTVALNAPKTEATVTLTGQARVAGDRDFFVQELKFFLRKIEGDWIIVRVETIRTLT
jgi:hypothetical protein